MKTVRTGFIKGRKNENVIYFQETCGGSQLYLDNVEQNKIFSHFESVTRKVQRLECSLIWNMLLGISSIQGKTKEKRGNAEIDIKLYGHEAFEINNPNTWDKKTLDEINETLLKNNIQFDQILVREPLHFGGCIS